MTPLEKEIRLLANARDRLYYLGAPSPICDDLDELIDQKIEAEMERLGNLSEEEMIAECAARGENFHQMAEQFRTTLLAAFDAAKSIDNPMGKAYHRPAAKPSRPKCDGRAGECRCLYCYPDV